MNILKRMLEKSSRQAHKPDVTRVVTWVCDGCGQNNTESMTYPEGSPMLRMTSIYVECPNCLTMHAAGQ